MTDQDEKTVLVLQGGGALGAYQAGAYEALCDGGHRPSWVAGISIGAVNAAIIAGNPLEKRVERLREFWDRVSSWLLARPLTEDDSARRIFNEASAALAAGLILILRPLLIRYLLAHPNARSSHQIATPQGAGVAVIAATSTTSAEVAQRMKSR